MKRIIILLLALIASFALYCQTRDFGYDDAGNRTSRTIPGFKSTASGEEEIALPKTYSEKLREFEIKLFPNPVNLQLSVEITGLETGQEVKIKVYDFTGRLMNSSEIYSGLIQLDFSTYPSGPYIIRINAGKESTEWKVVKE